jgi:hypothetical protein
MALTPLRWVAALIAGCLIVGVAVLAGEERLWGRDSDLDRRLSRRVDTHERHASAAAGRLRFAQLMDSMHVAIAADSSPSLRVFRDAALPVETHATLDSLAQHSLQAVRDSGRAGIDIVFVYDTLTILRGATIHRYGTRVEYVLPVDAGRRCTVIARLGKVVTRDGHVVGGFLSEAAVDRLLGPCAFYRAFGVPGPLVNSWLRQRGWAFAGDGSWTRPALAIDLSVDVPWQTEPIFIASFGPGMSGRFAREMNLDGVQCAAGKPDACDSGVLAFRMQTAPVFWRQNVLYESYPALGAGRGAFYYPYYYGWGRREPYLLADMVRTLGRDRFARFWTSSESVPVAFEKASGEPLSQWTSRWVEDQYGTLPPRGAGVSSWAGAMSIMLSVFAIFIGVRVNAHRQFA